MTLLLTIKICYVRDKKSGIEILLERDLTSKLANMSSVTTLNYEDEILRIEYKGVCAPCDRF